MADAIRFWLLIEVVGLLALPLAAAFFARLPGGGLVFARPLGLLLATYPVWLLASAHLVPYGVPSAWAGVLVLGLISGATAAYRRRHGRPDPAAPFARSLWLAGEGLFLLAYGASLVLRSFAPDVWGTEKPMDIAFINAINRSAWMPPHDPWLSGATINYYYYGHFIVAWSIRLTGVAPWVGFNLAVAAFYALSALGTFGVASALYAAARAGGHAPDVSPVIPGLLAAAFAVLLGNLAGALELVQKPGPLATFDWWSPSRVIATTINEFPFFSFLLADLHAHMLAAPFGLVALGFASQLALAGPVWAAAIAGGTGHRPAVAAGGELLLAALLVGSLYALNGWDYPTELGIGLLCLLLWATRRDPGPRPVWRLAGWAACWILLSVVLFVPFYLHFKAPEGGVAIVSQHASFGHWLHDYFLLYGLFAWVLGAGFAAAARRPELAGRHIVWAAIVLAALLALLAPAHLAGLALLLAAVAFALGAATDSTRDAPSRLWWLLVAVAVGLATVGELVYIRDAFAQTANYRMNTVFKFGYQAWFIFAVTAGSAVVWSKRWMSAAARPAWYAALAVLLCGAAVYTVAGTIAREDGFRSTPTLDGLRWLERQAPGDAAAIRWLNAEVQGAPTLVEAVGTDYDPAGHARVSTFTGLPTVLGWPGHEVQWDHDADGREQDVRTLYSTPDIDTARAILTRYHVRYIFVGSLERADYPAAGLQKLAQLGQVVFSQDGTIVYAVGS